MMDFFVKIFIFLFIYHLVMSFTSFIYIGLITGEQSDDFFGETTDRFRHLRDDSPLTVPDGLLDEPEDDDGGVFSTLKKIPTAIGIGGCDLPPCSWGQGIIRTFTQQQDFIFSLTDMFRNDYAIFNNLPSYLGLIKIMLSYVFLTLHSIMLLMIAIWATRFLGGLRR